MFDIKKYLEDQSKQKSIAVNKKKEEEEKLKHSIKSYETRYKYQDSSDEDSPKAEVTLHKQSNVKLEKIRDDGDAKLYNHRMNEWKASRKKPESGEGDNFLSNPCDFHELENGLKIPKIVWKKLYRYQKTAVKWLWELHQNECGGLLGDEMGLGKTVQIIAFLSALSVSGIGAWNGLGPTLIIAPATVIHQWVQHFHEWWPPMRVALLHQSGTFAGSPCKLVRDIHKAHGILITTYAGIVKHKSAFECNWHYVILDEGHKIRNADTQISQIVRRIQTTHRIVITGSPLQNNLQELWSLFDFMIPGLLGTQNAFLEHFAIPITQGGYSNASQLQEALALSLATTLKNTIMPYMLRRTKSDVKDHLTLPDKSEQVLFCSMSDEQKDLYMSFLKGETVRSILDKESRFGDPMRARILVALTTLRKICNHPDLYIYEVEGNDDDAELAHNFGHWRRSGKMVVINSLLKIWKKQGHRVLIFTQSRAMLCILEQFLQNSSYKYLKMDGTTSVGCRQPIISTFNTDDSYLVFLATTRVGGLGVNLTGADRVIIYDPDWNPATDSQAKERAWRIGQLRNVTVYRLLSAGTIEEKIYQRQVFKQLLSNKVLIDPNQKNFLKTSTLQGLFALEEPDKAGETETTSIFKHTKIPKKQTGDSPLLSGGVSFSASKMEAMRKLAQKISKSLSAPKSEEVVVEEDPRERYKRKLLPPPPPPEVVPVNTIDDRETEADFSTIMSEIDIVNMYSQSKSTKTYKKEIIERAEMELDASDESCSEKVEDVPQNSKSDDNIETKRRKRKRKKSKKRRTEKLIKLEEPEDKNQDDYVLEKLFAKSGVQNALQHDKVVGLAEREERHRLKAEADEKAMQALRALRKSKFKH